MDNQVCHLIPDTQSIKKCKPDCEKPLYKLAHTEEGLSRPLINFTEEEVVELVEQLRIIIKSMHSLSAKTRNGYICSQKVVFANLRNAAIELKLALDQVNPTEDKVLLYRSFFSLWDDFNKIFSYGLSQTTDAENPNTSDSRTRPPHRPLYGYKVMPDFSSTVLPNLSTLFQGTNSISPEQCEQAIIDIKKLQELFEQQKDLLNISFIPLYEDDECAALQCKLGVALAHAGELTQNLMRLLFTFQSRCHSQSKKAMQAREEITYYLTLLNYHYNNMLQKMREMRTFQDRARFLHQTPKTQAENIIYIRG